MPPGRAIKRTLISGRSEIIGNHRTEGHGIMSEANFKPAETPSTNNKSNQEPTLSSLLDHKQLKFLKSLKARPYISFD
jgi:hypothetical protein